MTTKNILHDVLSCNVDILLVRVNLSLLVPINDRGYLLIMRVGRQFEICNICRIVSACFDAAEDDRDDSDAKGAISRRSVSEILICALLELLYIPMFELEMLGPDNKAVMLY